MGWNSFAHNGRDTKAILKDELECENAHASWKIKDIGGSGSVYYVLIEKRFANQTNKHQLAFNQDADGAFRFIAVVLVSRDRFEIAYKEIDETSGPCETKCPQRILKAASSYADDVSDSNYGVEWRARCWEYHKRPKVNMQNLRVGSRIRFQEEITFGGISACEFEVATYRIRGKERKCFYNKVIGLCRITNLSDRKFEVIAA